MGSYEINVTATFGLEAVVRGELSSLGYEDLKTENGRISFRGDGRDIARCNIRLRCADRVLVNLKSFPASDFDELFEGVKSIDWGDIIPKNGMMHVVGKSVRSKLHGVPACQSIVKKAIIEKMKQKYGIEKFPEDGPTYKIEVSLYKDEASISLDSSGSGLHRRGYREEAGEAPLRENLAAALVLLSRWDISRVLADPFCGSGTIGIEAALIGKNVAPGLLRDFASEKWNQIPKGIWKEERERALADIIKDDFRVLCSDVDPKVLNGARQNAANAKVSDLVAFQTLPASEFRSRKKFGVVVTNPPYGERLGEKDEVASLYKEMGKFLPLLDSWSVFVLTAHPDFEKLYGQRATRNRKLYNGNIKCYYYEYFGPLPKYVAGHRSLVTGH